jgi:hypothetical protein
MIIFQFFVSKQDNYYLGGDKAAPIASNRLSSSFLPLCHEAQTTMPARLANDRYTAPERRRHLASLGFTRAI